MWDSQTKHNKQQVRKEEEQARERMRITDTPSEANSSFLSLILPGIVGVCDSVILTASNLSDKHQGSAVAGRFDPRSLSFISLRQKFNNKKKKKKKKNIFLSGLDQEYHKFLYRPHLLLLERGEIATRTTFLLTAPLFLLSRLQIFQLCPSELHPLIWFFFKNSFRKKKNIWKTT